jgi:hypothetical protein
VRIATILALVALAPGSIAIFAWFLLDLRKIFARDPVREDRGGSDGSGPDGNAGV